MTDNVVFEGNPHLCVPLFAKLRFANSPLVALLSIRVFRPLRRSTNAARRWIRGRFLKKATQKLSNISLLA